MESRIHNQGGPWPSWKQFTALCGNFNPAAMASMEKCLERSRDLYANPMPLPPNAIAMVSFCRFEGEKPDPLSVWR